MTGIWTALNTCNYEVINGWTLWLKCTILMILSLFLYPWCSGICGLHNWGDILPPLSGQFWEPAKCLTRSTPSLCKHILNYLSLRLLQDIIFLCSNYSGPGTRLLETTPVTQSQLMTLFRLVNSKMCPQPLCLSQGKYNKCSGPCFLPLLLPPGAPWCFPIWPSVVFHAPPLSNVIKKTASFNGISLSTYHLVTWVNQDPDTDHIQTVLPTCIFVLRLCLEFTDGAMEQRSF